MTRTLRTAKGDIRLPTLFPVTTFGRDFEVDELIRPHLDRFCPGVLASLHYARHLNSKWHRPLFIDSGGFASLMQDARIIDFDEHCGIETGQGSIVRADRVLSIQEQFADIGSTLDFIIPPSMKGAEAKRRQDLTVQNALWALRHKNHSDLLLYASIQAWDAPSARDIMEKLAPHPFDGFALGGMVPRLSDPDIILQIVNSIRAVEHKRPLHVFGIGSPKMMRHLFDSGVDSTDTSTYVRQAASGRYLDLIDCTYRPVNEISNLRDRCSCTVCRTFDGDYLALEGPLNRMALALHNLDALLALSGLQSSECDSTPGCLACISQSEDVLKKSSNNRRMLR